MKNFKKLLALVLSALMVISCLSGMMIASAEEAADPNAPQNVEEVKLFNGNNVGPHGKYTANQSVGVKITVPEGKRVVKIAFSNLAFYANGDNISYLHVPELAELNAANRNAFGDFAYMMLAAQNEEPLHTARKTDDEDYRIERTRLALVATGTESSVHAFIPNLEDGLSTRFLYHNLPAKGTVRDEMDEAMAEAFNDVYAHHRNQLTEIWKELRQFDGKSDEELPRLMLSDAQRSLINDYYRQLVSFIALTQPDHDLRAPILRTRLNLYRMLMVIAVLRRHEESGTAEGMFADRVFTATDADLRWGLTYIFYLMMQTSAIYNRLRAPLPVKEATHLSALAFFSLLPPSFTTEVAVKLGDEQGIKSRAVRYQLSTLCSKGYIERVRQGVYRKAKRMCVRKTAA